MRKKLVAVVVVLGGCQLFVSSDVTQCATDGDCESRGGEFTGSVCIDTFCVRRGDRCLGRVPEALEDRTKPLNLRMRFADVGGNPLRDIEVLVCAALDEACDNPVGVASRTDASGYVNLAVWKNFKGSVQVKRPPTTPEYLKAKIHFLAAYEIDDPTTREIPLEESVRLISRSLYSLQVTAAGGTLDPNAGQVIASVMDCDLRPREGASVKAAAGGAAVPFVFYFTDSGSGVSREATATPTNGRFGIVNAPPGPLELEATIVATGKRLGRAQIFVNKDTISNFAITPTP